MQRHGSLLLLPSLPLHSATFYPCSDTLDTGTFKAPPPGQQVDKPYSKDLQPGQVKSLDDETARSNFRVVVIKPDEVEMLDLSSPDPSESRRFVYTFDEASGSWRNEECWP